MQRAETRLHDEGGDDGGEQDGPQTRPTRQTAVDPTPSLNRGNQVSIPDLDPDRRATSDPTLPGLTIFRSPPSLSGLIALTPTRLDDNLLQKLHVEGVYRSAPTKPTMRMSNSGFVCRRSSAPDSVRGTNRDASKRGVTA